jgi:hypothetical protein
MRAYHYGTDYLYRVRKLIFLLILVLAGYVGYLYFFGKREDKASAQAIVGESRDLVKAVSNFLSHQKSKYDDGEFDKLIQKADHVIQKIKDETLTTEQPYKDELNEMLNELRKIDPTKLSPENQEKLEKTKKELKKLLQSK